MQLLMLPASSHKQPQLMHLAAMVVGTTEVMESRGGKEGA